MGWIINGGYGSTDKLNERPIYLRSFFLILAFIQALSHIYKDFSSISIKVELPEEDDKTQGDRLDKHSLVETLSRQAMPYAKHAAILAGSCTLLAPFIYTALLRSISWSIHMSFAQHVANISRSDRTPSGAFYIGSVMFTGLWAGFLLVSMWELNVYLFTTYLIDEPMRNGQPLSTASKDPNGTLLTGLRSKKDPTRSFAFWEFHIIAQKNAQRRRDIFSDIERPNQGSMFAAMVGASLNVMNEMIIRITTPNSKTIIPQPPPQDDVPRLPRILSPAVPAKSQIYTNGVKDSSKTLERITNFVSEEAKRVGNAAQPWSPPVDRGKRLAIEYSKPTVADLNARAEAAQQSILGRYLLTQPTRLINSTILGSPIGNSAVLVFATRAVTDMMIASLQEDTYGKASGSLPAVVKTLTRSISLLRSYVRQHTNNGIVSQKSSKELQDVLMVNETFKHCLSELLHSFRMFLTDIGLGIQEVNEAKRTTELGPLFEIAGAGQNESRENSADSHNSDHHRDMDEIGEQGQNTEATEQDQRRKQKSKSNASNEQQSKRPKQLFSQLEPGSAYQRSLRIRRQSIGQGADFEINPLLAGNVRKTIDEPHATSNYNTVPSGGLQRRKMTEVR